MSCVHLCREFQRKEEAMKTRVVTSIAAVVVILVGMWAGVAQAGTVLPSLHVGSILQRYLHYGDGYHLVSAAVSIHDLEHFGVAKARVSVLWKLPGEDRVVQQADTDEHGLAQFQLRSMVHGTYQLCVASVYKSGWVYDPKQNHVTCTSLIVR
jgi:hypothetical protein